ncbi:MAG TPA: DUF2383 domain-containing protein [Noviherbaspirillum sp.]|nr:DUF2383 domain-containing protein [Noviherbaspirillum sp.]
MLLRDDTQMAISQVETLCIESADHYAVAAEKAGDATLAKLFVELAHARRELAAALARHIRAGDDLPQPPDPDKVAVGEVLADIKGWLSGDARSVLIGQRERDEESLAEAVRSALGHEMETGMRSTLQDILAHAEAAKGKLAALHA